MRARQYFVAVFFFMMLMRGTAFTGDTPKPSQEADKKETVNLSVPTQACITCHSQVTPGIVEDWKKSRHAHVTPREGMSKPELSRRISSTDVPSDMKDYVVGCYECHSQNPEQHKDNFKHMGYSINVIVTPNDCKTCHPTETAEYLRSKMGYAYRTIMRNPLYHLLVKTVNGVKTVENGVITAQDPSYSNLHETCLGCHGTKIEVKGMKEVYVGRMGLKVTVPDLENWPSQGVGRENPDGSYGACSSCHSRHEFSIKEARKPYTCAQCHLDPDVPAWNVYKESKHGNLYDVNEHSWNFSNVPWVIGKDFQAPTCATCHNSLIVSPSGEVIAERTHDFGDRLWVRLFGLIYSVPQPKSGDTTIIKNRDGLPMPVTFTGEPAAGFLIDKPEQEKRMAKMTNVCRSCHSTSWINGHFAKLDKTIEETNAMTLSATKLMVGAWEKGIEDKTNPFDENIEKLWIKQWLFYANSIRYASAMTGAPDYAAFKNGWWELSHNLQMMHDLINSKSQEKGQDEKRKEHRSDK